MNSLEDRPLRARSLPGRELEPDYVAEESGQTVHFFSGPLTCASSWRDGSRCSWFRFRSGIARRVSRSSTSGAA
ncbi:MAG: hypothetical protein ACRDNF_11830 [Streptosporangiaceae bacterium]